MKTERVDRSDLTGSTARPYRLFVLAALVALTVPRMTQRGMFADGLLYATVARNMSIGVGSFWAPTYTVTTDPEFFEHPPVGLALQAFAFWLFGDHFAVERLFSLVMFGLTAAAIASIWRRLQPPECDWLPLLFWILPSTVTWGVVNNMLENTQTLFTSAAILALLLAARATTGRESGLWATAAGGAVVAAVLTKGPIGFFPLAVPVLFPLLPYPVRPRRAMLVATIMIGVTGVAALALAAYEPSRRALTEYLHTQLLASLQGRREVNADPLSSFKHLGLGVIARMVVVCGLFWLFALRRIAQRPRWTPAAFFVSAGLCASVPISVSPKLVGHYFLPSVPLFALGFASLTVAPAMALMACPNRWARRVPLALAVILAAATIAVPPLYGALEPRDRALLRDLDALDTVMPRGVVIGACEQSATDWRLHTYVNRFWAVALDARNAPVGGWLLQAGGTCAAAESCVPAARGERLALFRCAGFAPPR